MEIPHSPATASACGGRQKTKNLPISVTRACQLTFALSLLAGCAWAESDDVPRHRDLADAMYRQVWESVFALTPGNEAVFIRALALRFLPPDFGRDEEKEASYVIYWAPLAHDPKKHYLAAHIAKAARPRVDLQVELIYAELDDEQAAKLTLNDIVEKLDVRTWDIDERTCPALRQTLMTFEELGAADIRFDYLDSADGSSLPTILLHTAEWEALASQSTQEMRIRSADRHSPFAQWFTRTTSSIDRCLEDSGE